MRIEIELEVQFINQTKAKKYIAMKKEQKFNLKIQNETKIRISKIYLRIHHFYPHFLSSYI